MSAMLKMELKKAKGIKMNTMSLKYMMSFITAGETPDVELELLVDDSIAAELHDVDLDAFDLELAVDVDVELLTVDADDEEDLDDDCLVFGFLDLIVIAFVTLDAVDVLDGFLNLAETILVVELHVDAAQIDAIDANHAMTAKTADVDVHDVHLDAEETVDGDVVDEVDGEGDVEDGDVELIIET